MQPAIPSSHHYQRKSIRPALLDSRSPKRPDTGHNRRSICGCSADTKCPIKGDFNSNALIKGKCGIL